MATLLSTLTLSYTPQLVPTRPSPSRCAAPRCSLAAAVHASLREKFDEAKIGRVIGAWTKMSDGYVHDANLPGAEREPMLRQQANSYIEGLPLQPFHDEQAHAWVRELEAKAHLVQEEFKQVIAGDELQRRGNNVWIGLADNRDAGTEAYGPEWRTLGLQDRGLWDAVNTQVCKTPCILHCRAPVPTPLPYPSRCPFCYHPAARSSQRRLRSCTRAAPPASRLSSRRCQPDPASMPTRCGSTPPTLQPPAHSNAAAPPRPHAPIHSYIHSCIRVATATHPLPPRHVSTVLIQLHQKKYSARTARLSTSSHSPNPTPDPAPYFTPDPALDPAPDPSPDRMDATST